MFGSKIVVKILYFVTKKKQGEQQKPEIMREQK